MIDTASNTVVGTPIQVGVSPAGVAVTPDGNHAYVTNEGSNNVSVIDTVTNTVVATVPVGTQPQGVGIVPLPACVPFSAFNAKLEIDLERKPNKDHFELLSSFTLGSASNGINPVGVIGVSLQALIAPTGSLRYALVAAAQDANLTGTVNPVPVTLTIGDDCGTASIQALISH